MMQITRETDYAIRSVLYLSQNRHGIKMVDEIAKEKEIPKPFLSKILQKLSRAGIVKSYRGIKGGFGLAREPKKISLLDVIVAIEGSVAMNICAIDRRSCKFSDACAVHPVWVELKKQTESFLKRYNFEKLSKK